MTHTKAIRRTHSGTGDALVIGFDGVEINHQIRRLLAKVQPAGVILFKRNIVTAEQTWELLNECQKCVPTPLFRCVDMEGGTVDRFRSIFGATPSAAHVFATEDRRLFRKHGRVIGQACRALGFNVDFAPTLDLALAPALPVMGTRVVSADPRKVVNYAREFLAGLDSQGVLGSGKHFPGLGSAALDTHKALPAIDKSMKALWAEDLLPYRRMRRELPMVMVSHAAYPAVTGGPIPASVSKKWITNILRNKIGYRGLIATDDMEMGALQASATMESAAIASVEAGADLLLICHQEELILRAHEAILLKAEGGRVFANRLCESTVRTARFKKARGLGGLCPRPTAASTEKITRAVWELEEQARLEGPLTERPGASA